jgi:hypothetical protein
MSKLPAANLKNREIKNYGTIRENQREAVMWIRIWMDYLGQKWPTKNIKSEKISCFEVLDVLF